MGVESVSKRGLFTPEELEELRKADEELDAEFVQTQEEIRESRKRDRAAQLDKLDNRGKKIADYQAAWVKKNREKWNAYQRQYRANKKAALRGANTEDGKAKYDSGILPRKRRKIK